MGTSPATEPASVASTPASWATVSWGLVRAIRPLDWTKNILVFAAAVFSGEFFHRQAMVNAMEAFAALCLVASATYLVNDVRDREADRYHPTKRKRPIASGVVPPTIALGVAVVLGGGGVALGFAVNRGTGLGVLGYLVLTTVYSLLLKHAVILDVLTLSSAFVLRVIVGAEAVQVEFSTWLVLCTFLLALFLGFGKRRHELVLLEDDAQPHRPVLTEYSPHFLDMMMAVVTTATVMSYALYTMAPETVARFHSRNLIYTSVFVLYGIFRYLYLIHKKSSGGSPVQMFYRDRPLQIAVGLWVASVFLLRYL